MVLEGERVKLIPLAMGHKSIYMELSNIPEIAERVSQPIPYTKSDFEGDIKNCETKENCFVWMIEYNGELCGVVNTAARINTEGKVYQGGYWLYPQKRGLGLATEANLLVKNFLLNEKKAVRLQALVEPDNLASIKVLKRCGYEREGLLRRYYPNPHRGLLDVYIYAYIA